MRHTDVLGPKIRAGVVRGWYCYQPFREGRLCPSVQLFPDRGEENEAFLARYFTALVKTNGDVIVLPKQVR